MVAASLRHYLRGHSRMLVSAAIVFALLAALFLLAFAVFVNDLTTGPLPDGQLVGPFRWKLDGAHVG